MCLDINGIKEFIASTRDIIYLREVDRILIIRPNKIQHLNETAFTLLYSIYNNKQEPETVIEQVSVKYKISSDDIKNDLIKLLETIKCIMNDDYTTAKAIETIPFAPESIKYPVLSEIALTYRCQNQCEFCYASSPYRGSKSSEMTTDEVKTIIERIARDAHVPTLSFTGGEPTIRKDLPELIEFADRMGLRTNLITNGIRCSEEKFVEKLTNAGLKSAQVSLESHCEELHNSIVNNDSAFIRTVNGITNLKNAGIYTHTNTTICQKNQNSLKQLVKFIKGEFDFPYLSMNMIIKTGIARDNDNVNINYNSIGNILEPLLEYCEILGIKFVWYSPTPYCIFNPVDHNLGSKSCACVSGLLSVNPSGEVLPCSSFNRGLGNLLKHSFEYIWNSDEALYWRERRYLPPVCRECGFETLCGGACPLYWEQAGSFSEIEAIQNKKPKIRNLFWKIENNIRVKAKGISGIKEKSL